MSRSKPGNSIYLEIGVWYDEDRGSIHIASNDVPNFHTTVRADAKLKRGHPNLFRKLAKSCATMELRHHRTSCPISSGDECEGKAGLKFRPGNWVMSQRESYKDFWEPSVGILTALFCFLPPFSGSGD